MARATQRGRHRRGRYRFLMTIFAVVALVVAFYLSSGLFFKITTIRVDGLQVYSEADIRAQSGFEIGENIFMINKMSAARTIMTKFPYVERVRIRRELPGTVVIEITESAPAALLVHNENGWIINTKGMLLESKPLSEAPDITRVTGIELIAPVVGNSVYFSDEEQSKKEPLLELLALLAERNMLGDVAEIDIEYLSNFIFTYTDRFTVEMGFPEDMGKKLDFLIESIPMLEEKSPGSHGRFYLETAVTDNRVRFAPE